jgi:pantoate--beta-alanine ligase
VEIIPCPIVREPDGLAMSSRNMLLSADERTSALALSRTLFEALKLKGTNSPDHVRKFVRNHLDSAGGVSVEYFEIVNGSTLLPATDWNEKGGVVGCLAARVGKVRLIDNINFSS